MTTPDRHTRLSDSRGTFAWGEHVNPDRLQSGVAVAEGSVLDIGCSVGGYVRAFQAHGLEAVGMDVLLPVQSDTWNGGRFVVGELPRCPFASNTFHTVTCFEVVEHLPDPLQGLRELVRVARSYVVLSVPDATRPPEHEASGFTYHHRLDPTHITAFTPESLRTILEQAGLRVLRLDGINPVTPEVLVLAQYRLPERLRSLLLRVLKRLPGRRPRTMTLLAVGLKNPDS